MFPASFQLPVAIALLAGGLIACFMGYRLFRLVLTIYGFVLGAFLTTSLLGPAGTWVTVAVIVAGGVVGALVLIAAYFMGVALVGAGLGALLVNLVWTQLGRDPHPLVVVLFAVVGALLALWLQRYVIIISTAFGGAWTAIIGGLATWGVRAAADAVARADVWLVYPLDPAHGSRWLVAGWIALGFVGTVVQLAITAKGKKSGKRG